MKRIFTIAVAATTLAGLGACSSDNKSYNRQQWRRRQTN